LVELVEEDKKRRIFLEMQRKPWKINFFGITKSSDIGRSLDNVLGKFRKFGLCPQIVMF